ncbi:MAG TPA: hypothetical protein DEB46_07170 [Myxococcales bacterium]|nr:hypothetical protein [Myxococcales bacterium]
MGFRSSQASASKRSFRAAGLVLLSLTGVLGACGEGLKPFTVVDRLRIAAVATEPVLHRPGENLTVKLLTLREADDTSPLSVLISGCVLTGPVQSCGPGTLPLPAALLPSFELETHDDENTGARTDTWVFAVPEEARGPILLDVVVVNCDVGDLPDPEVVGSGLDTLLTDGEVKAPAEWTCAEDPLRMSRSIWVARHLVSPAVPGEDAVVNLVPAAPRLTRMEDQTELDPGLIRTEIEATTEGLVLEDEPRWFWFSTSPNGVVMRVSASEGGKTKALVLEERDRLFSYWAIVRDNAGRVGWSSLHLPPDQEIP